MKTFTTFISVIALGLIAGAVIVTTLNNSVAPALGAGSMANDLQIDQVSLIIGIVIGAITANLARMEWANIPRHLANWILTNAPTFGYLVTALVLAAVVIYY